VDLETGKIKKTWRSEFRVLPRGLEISDGKMYFIEIRENEGKGYLNCVDLDTFSLKWKINLEGCWWEYSWLRCIILIKHNERIYFNSGAYFYSIEAGTGRTVWKRKIESSSVLNKETVYCCNNMGLLFALDAATGIELWRIHITLQSYNLPSLVSSEQVLFIAENKVLLAFDFARRKELWWFSIQR